jgi:hypothetical protein
MSFVEHGAQNRWSPMPGSRQSFSPFVLPQTAQDGGAQTVTKAETAATARRLENGKISITGPDSRATCTA